MADTEPEIPDLNLPTRDATRDKWLRDHKLYFPDGQTHQKSIAYGRASLMADMAAPIYGRMIPLARILGTSTKSGAALTAVARSPRYATDRLAAVGAAGSVRITASAGGGTIFAGDELKIGNSRYRCLQTALYVDGQACPVQGIDVGPETDKAPGTVGRWTYPRPGIGDIVTVIEHTDGTGLSGGRLEETDPELIARLQQMEREAAMAGNEPSYRRMVKETPGIAIEEVFTYASVPGPGQLTIAFTLRPGAVGASRIPTDAQLELVRNHLRALRADDGVNVVPILASPLDLAFSVMFPAGKPGFTDRAPFPAWDTVNAEHVWRVAIGAVPTPSATQFVITNGNNGTPVAGSVIAFYNPTAKAFVRKRILTATGGPMNWTVTVDTAANNSDVLYVPKEGQPFSPWSDSLNSLIDPVLRYMDKRGPGEVINYFPDELDEGWRQRRRPTDPIEFPSIIDHDLRSVFSTKDVRSANTLNPAFLPYYVEPGSLASVNMFTLGYLNFYPF